MLSQRLVGLLQARRCFYISKWNNRPTWYLSSYVPVTLGRRLRRAERCFSVPLTHLFEQRNCLHGQMGHIKQKTVCRPDDFHDSSQHSRKELTSSITERHTDMHGERKAKAQALWTKHRGHQENKEQNSPSTQPNALIHDQITSSLKLRQDTGNT